MNSWISNLLLALVLFVPILSDAKPNQNKTPKTVVHQFLDVASEAEFKKAFYKIERNKGHATITLKEGVYNFKNRIWMKYPNVTIQGENGDPTKVIINGFGMKKTPGVKNIFDIAAPNITLKHLTIQNAPNHIIQVHGKRGADHFLLENCHIKNAYEQLIKVTTAKGKDAPTADFGIIRNNLFEYTAGIGPQYYIAGIDAHRAQDWLVENNEFRNIASPDDRISEFAIHFWNGSRNIIVRNNKIVDSDRGIGFGMKRKLQTVGGEISGNVIYHSDNHHKFADVGISLMNTTGTTVSNNRIILEHDYPNAIEFRFKTTTDITIENNVVNKAITSRNGGSALVKNNTKL